MGLFSGMWESIKEFFSGASASGSDGSRLYVGNLSYKASEGEVRSLFAKHGKVKSVHLIKDKFTRKPKGYAFVEMSTEDGAKALQLNGYDFLGRKLVVSVAKSRGEQEPRPQQNQNQNRSQNQGQPRRQGGGQNRWRRRRNGPRAYGQKGSEGASPIERLE